MILAWHLLVPYFAYSGPRGKSFILECFTSSKVEGFQQQTLKKWPPASGSVRPGHLLDDPGLFECRDGGVSARP